MDSPISEKIAARLHLHPYTIEDDVEAIYEELTYEAYGPNGIAVLVEVLNRFLLSPVCSIVDAGLLGVYVCPAGSSLVLLKFAHRTESNCNICRSFAEE